MPTQAIAYAEFKKALQQSGCMKCGLAKGRTQIVVDRGNPEAQVMFVGEAPGENEDRQGRAFVGRAGRLLDQMLEALGFDTDQDALIANIAKCRPPKNRAPHPEEAQMCMPYLKQQIELVRPKIIALLGATALKHLIPEKKTAAMQSEAGRFFSHTSYPSAKWIVLFHPAYILRDPRKRPLMEEHLKLLVGEWRRLG